MRKLHRWLGVVMLLPLLAWLLTGLVFFIKPGYGDAYASLALRTYPVGDSVVSPSPDWLEYRVLRTVLGEHVLARTTEGWQHAQRDGRSLPVASEEDIRLLVDDALQQHPERYGRVVAVQGHEVLTDTGVRVTLDWHTLALRQYGTDTAWIDTLYRIHYLQWTGVSAMDQALGMLGLALLALLSALGARLAWRGPTARTRGVTS